MPNCDIRMFVDNTIISTNMNALEPAGASVYMNIEFISDPDVWHFYFYPARRPLVELCNRIVGAM